MSSQNIKCMMLFRVLSALSMALRSASVFDNFLLLNFSNYATVGLVSSAGAFAALFTSMFAGILIDYAANFQPTILRIAFLIAPILIVFDYHSITSPTLFNVIVACVLWRIWYEVVFVTADTLFAASIPQGNRSIYFTYRRMLVNMANALAPLVSAYIFYYYGNHWNLDILRIILKLALVVRSFEIIPLAFWVDISQSDQTSLPLLSKYNAVPSRQLGFLTEQSVPWLLLLSQFIAHAGGGMTVKFLPLFIKQQYHLSPISICTLHLVATFATVVSTYGAQRFSNYAGRAGTSLLFQFFGTGALVLMTQIYSTNAFVMMYLLRNALRNAPLPINKSIMMDYVNQENRAKWNAASSSTSIAWSSSALLGGILADLYSFRITFSITGPSLFCL